MLEFISIWLSEPNPLVPVPLGGRPASSAFFRAPVAYIVPVALCFPRTQEDKMKKAFVIPFLLLIAATAIAQVKDPVSSALREIMPGRLKNTIAAVESMPADKFSYAPSPDQLTFGHLVAHMVEANYLLCGKAADVPAPKVDAVKETDPKDKLVAALKASFDFCSDAITKMDDSKLGEVTEGGPGGQKVSRARFALGIASNWADHYAEAAMYLRQNGILPPTAKK